MLADRQRFFVPGYSFVSGYSLTFEKCCGSRNAQGNQKCHSFAAGSAGPFGQRCRRIGARRVPSPEFPKILEKNPHKKSLQVARNCAIIQKLEYAGSRGRLHALKRRVTTGRAETSSLTKRGRQGRAGAWDALRSLYVDASNFKSPFGSREHITWRCNHTWHVLRA